MLKGRAIASARAAVERFDVIASILDLEPRGSWKFWEDNEGNRLRITKNHTIYVYPAKNPEQKTKDIFRKARPKIIAQKSYWVLSLFGKKDSVLAFLGNDGILRCCYFKKNTWIENLSPVLLGIHALRYISSGYIDNESRKISSMKIVYPKHFKIEEAWASGYPSDDLKLQERICRLII